jgi:taurine dioxygenase
LKLPEDAIAFGRGWHMDMSYRARPPMGTFLHGKEIPEVGGDTCFASLTYAWLMLSERMRTMLSDLIAVHESWPPDALLYGGMGLKNLDKPREVARHPLAGSHPESNDPILFVSPYYAREIEGMTPEESRAMFDFLNAHATRGELTCRVRWEPDTIVMWDNRSTIHEALDDDLEAKLHGRGYRRRMHRAVVRDPRPTP